MNLRRLGYLLQSAELESFTQAAGVPPAVAPPQGLWTPWALVTSRERGGSLAGRKRRELIVDAAGARIAAGRRLRAETVD